MEDNTILYTRCKERNWPCFKGTKKGHGANICKQELIVVKPIRVVKKTKGSWGWWEGLSGLWRRGRRSQFLEIRNLEMTRWKSSRYSWKIPFEVDTGACCTVMSQAQFWRAFGLKKMKFQQNLKTVTGQTVVV